MDIKEDYRQVGPSPSLQLSSDMNARLDTLYCEVSKPNAGIDGTNLQRPSVLPGFLCRALSESRESNQHCRLPGRPAKHHQYSLVAGATVRRMTA